MRKTIIQVGGAIVSAGFTAFSLISDLYGFVPNIKWQIIALIGFLFFIVFIGWIIWDKQRQINKFTSGIELNFSLNPKTYDNDMEFILDIEIWTDKDIHTDNLVLNFEGVRGIAMLTTPWWNIRKILGIILLDWPFFKKTFGLRTENWEYRRHIKCSEVQPFKDTVTFKLSDVKDMFKWSNLFMLELVLVTGIPRGKFRKYLEIPKGKTLEPI